MADASTSLVHGHTDPIVHSAAVALQSNQPRNARPTIQADPSLPIPHGSASGPSACIGTFSHDTPLMAPVSVPIVISNPEPYNDIPDLNLPTQMENPRHPHHSELLAPGTASKFDDVGYHPLEDLYH